MKVNKTIGIILIGVFSLLGCKPTEGWTPPGPTFLSGIVKGEHYQDNILEQDKYKFSVETESGFKTFINTGANSASTLDSLINKGDSILIKVDNLNIKEYSEWEYQIIEINGKTYK